MPYYGVSVGKVPGVYTSWAACKEQVNEFKGAKHKRFDNRFSAQRFVNGSDTHKMKQLTLDDTLTKKLDFTPSSPTDKKGWSDARKRCWAFQKSMECNNSEDSYERRMTHAFGH